MAKQKRCPNCGASNPETAQWCSLCLQRFDEPGSEPEAGLAATPTEGEGPAPVRSDRPRPDYSAFKVTEEGIKWICPTCANPNNLDMTACTACGTTFAQAVRPEPTRIEREPATVALMSLFLPGAGHAYMGMWGQAVARGVLWLWVLGIAIVGLLDKDVPGSLVMALLFGLAAFALWAITAHDAYREALNQPKSVLLRDRRFLYLVLGLMGLLFVLMFIALLTARSKVDETSDGVPSSIQAWRSTSSRTFMGPPTS